MEAQSAVFDAKPLLRPSQVEDAKSEIKAAEAKLQSPHIEDKGEVLKQLRRLKHSFETQVPRPPVDGEEEGRMVERSKHLLAEILVGMPSQEEMRKSPPGAVDKHMAWEKRNKLKILEWKNLQIRLSHGEEKEAANLERHRPIGSSLNMDNAYIPGKMFFMPPAGAGLSVAFSGEQIAYLKSIGLEVGLMDNEQRGQVKEVLVGGISLEEGAGNVDDPRKTPEYRARAAELGRKGTDKQYAWKRSKQDKKKPRKPLSEERKQALREQLARGRAAQAAAKADEKLSENVGRVL